MFDLEPLTEPEGPAETSNPEDSQDLVNTSFSIEQECPEIQSPEDLAYNNSAVAGGLRGGHFLSFFSGKKLTLDRNSEKLIVGDNEGTIDCYYLGRGSYAMGAKMFKPATLIAPESAGAEFLRSIKNAAAEEGLSIFKSEKSIYEPDPENISPGSIVSLIASNMAESAITPLTLWGSNGRYSEHILVLTEELYPDPLTTGNERDRLLFIYNRLWEELQEPYSAFVCLPDPQEAMIAMAHEAGLSACVDPENKNTVIIASNEESVVAGVPLGLKIHMDLDKYLRHYISWLHH